MDQLYEVQYMNTIINKQCFVIKYCLSVYSKLVSSLESPFAMMLVQVKSNLPILKKGVNKIQITVTQFLF